MGVATLFEIGHISEARARFNFEDREELQRVIEIPCVLDVELQMLRCILQGLTVIDYKVKANYTVYPNPTDPEYDEWYSNIEEEAERAVLMLLPEFLAELEAIKPEQFSSLGVAWSNAVGNADFIPELATKSIQGLIELARNAKDSNKGVFMTVCV